MRTFESLLAELSASGVEYILVGGLAVDLCGFSRATMDVDILIEPSLRNVALLLTCLKGFGEGSAEELQPADFTSEEGCIRVVEDFPLDIFTVIGGKTYEDLLSDTLVHKTGAHEIRYLGARGLIGLKSSSARSKDRIDVQELTAILQRDAE